MNATPKSATTVVQSGLASRIGLVTAGRVGAMLLTLLAGIGVARALEVGERGALAVALSCSLIISVLLTAGVDSAVLRSCGRGETTTAIRACGRRLINGLAICLVIAGVLVLVPPGTVFGLGRAEVAIAVLSAPLAMASSMTSAILLGVGDLRRWCLSTVSAAATYFGSVLAFAAASVGSVLTFLLCLALSQVIGIGLAARTLVARSGGAQADHAEEFRRSARSSAPSAIAQLAMLRVQIPLLQLLAGVSAVGLFAVATPLVEALLVVPIAASAVLLPAYSGGHYSIGAAVRHAARVGFVTSAAGAVLCAAAPWFVPLVYGDAYAPAVQLVYVMTPGVVVFAACRVLQARLMAEGRFRLVSASGVVGVLVLVIVQLAAVPRWEDMGAAVALSSAYAVSGILLAAGCVRRDRVSQGGRR